MSQTLIRTAFETRLNTLSPPIATAYENAGFSPPALTLPYQKCHTLFARPDNPETGTGYRELGYFQVTLLYPAQAGAAAASARAKLIRDLFPKNLSMTNSGIVVTISRTPEIGNGAPDGERWMLPVKIPFFVNNF